MNSNTFQQNQLANNNANDVNGKVNSDNFKRITQLAPQTTNDPQKDAFFNGTKFCDTNDFESLVLPAGSGSTSIFS